MNNIQKQSTADKKKLEKMNMNLNNLEQKLGSNEALCQGVAKIIEMTIECDAIVGKLESINTNIPELERRIVSLSKGCVTSCSDARKNLMGDIQEQVLADKDTAQTIEYMLKIQKTIDYCIDNYQIYKMSKYNSKYCVCGDAESNLSSMNTDEELLMLI